MNTVCALAVLVAFAADARAQQVNEQEAWARFDVWLQAIESHRPGEDDEAVRAMLALTPDDLESAVPQMVFTLREAMTLLKRRPRFDDTFSPYAANSYKPRDAWRVSLSAQRVSGAGLDAFLRRAAMLHADIAVSSPDAHRTRRFGRGILTADGRQHGDEGRPWHWILGRAFLHLLPDTGSDPYTRAWYHAAGNYLLATRNFTESEPHLARGVALFPADAEISFLKGWSHDAQASPVIQAAVAEEIAAIPERHRAGYQAGVRSAKAEQQDAIAAYEKAVAADPSHLEARMRLGRLLTIHGKGEDAVRHLRAVIPASSDPRQKYLAQLFLGRALETSRDFAGAREAYEAARTLIPAAQAPRVALSQLALHAGDRDAALAMLAEAAGRDREHDPWWSFYYRRLPEADVWIERLRALLRERSR